MYSFVYIDDAFRKLMDVHVGEHSKVDREWKTDYVLARAKEEAFILYNRMHPRTNCINDSLGERDFIWPMDNMSKHFSRIDYRYYDEIDKYDFKSLMFMRAQELAEKGKQIDVFYSGGLDSTAMLLAFREVCDRGQVRVLTGGDEPLRIGPRSLIDYVLSGPHVIDKTGDLYGIASPDTNVYTTGTEIDCLFGSTGNPIVLRGCIRDKKSLYGYTDTHDVNNKSDFHKKENDDWNYDNWWDFQRYFNRTRAFRFIKNFSGEKVDLSNHCDFYIGDNIYKWAINKHNKRQIVWFDQNQRHYMDVFLSSKMMLREFVGQLCDKDWAFNILKTATKFKKDSIVNPKNNIIAITNNGTIVTRENVGDYLNDFERIVQL